MQEWKTDHDYGRDDFYRRKVWAKSVLEITFTKGGGLRLWDTEEIETVGIFDTLRQAKTAGDNYLIDGGLIRLSAWIGNGWRLVRRIREIRRGKNKNKFEIEYQKGTGFKKAIVEKNAVVER